MKTSKLTAVAASIAVALLLNAPQGSAQEPQASAAPVASPSASPVATSETTPAPATPGAGDRQQQFRQRMNERMNEMAKTVLKVDDTEWSVIQPLLEKVRDKQRETGRSPFGFIGGGRRGGPGAPGANVPAPDATPGAPRPQGLPDFGHTPETVELQKAVFSEEVSAETIKAKLEAVREARKKAETEYEQACQDLVKVLTQRQEAVLVLIGVLQ